MDDLINRQDAIGLEYIVKNINGVDYVMLSEVQMKLRKLPSTQPEQKDPCSACEGLENGDTLYAYSDWDGGIGFDYIRDIKFCPVCGRRLNNG